MDKTYEELLRKENITFEDLLEEAEDHDDTTLFILQEYLDGERDAETTIKRLALSTLARISMLSKIQNQIWDFFDDEVY